MTEIVPAINLGNFSRIKGRIEEAARFVPLVHIDVADGSFTPSAAWHNPRDLEGYRPPCRIEIHFMVARPEEKIADWLLPQISRLIFHAEATDDASGLIDQLHKAHIEAGVAIRPDTSWETLRQFFDRTDLLQVLAVPPGPSGQEFRPETLEKIRALRKESPRVPIEVDGGIGVGIARACKDAGANFLVVGNSLFESGATFEEALKKIRDDVS